MPNKYYFLSNYCKLFRLTSAYNFSAEYDVHVEQKTHAEAIRACKRLGRKLFEPRDFSANSEVLALAKSKGVTRFWIGIHDITNEGNFTYDSNGQTISYMNWFLNEPNNIGSGEDCAEAMVGNWNDLSCKGKRPFVCEKTQKTSSRRVETCKILIISTIVPIQISDTNHKLILQLMSIKEMSMITMMISMKMRSVKLILDPRSIKNVSFHLLFEEIRTILA